MSARLSSQECIIAECKSALHTAQEERDDIQELFQITQKERDVSSRFYTQKCCTKHIIFIALDHLSTFLLYCLVSTIKYTY